MDDLVVIILTLIIVIVGVLGQVKKKKQIPVVSEGKKSPENIWDLIQREMNPMPQMPQQEFIDDDFEEPEVKAKKSSYEFEAQNERVSATENKIMEELPAKKMRKIYNEKFSLKKAVIYSEILNRKYT